MARILIVDDEATILMVLRTILDGSGHVTVARNSGVDALKLIESEKFDLLISDVRMDPVDGIRLLKAARQLDPPLPTILVTAFAFPVVGQTPQELGAFACLRKPFNSRELLHTVGEALATASSRKS